MPKFTETFCGPVNQGFLEIYSLHKITITLEISIFSIPISDRTLIPESGYFGNSKNLNNKTIVFIL